MNYQKAKEEFYRHLRRQNYAVRSFERFETVLKHFEAYLKQIHQSLQGMTAADLKSYDRLLSEEKSRRPQTILTYWISLKVFFRFLVGEGVLLLDPLETFQFTRLKDKRRLPQVFTPSEMNQVLRHPVAPDHPFCLRNLALMELLYSSGLRAGELTRLKQSDVDLAQGLILIRQGKGGKDRVVPLGRKASEALFIYLQESYPKLNQARREELFLTYTGRPMGKQAIAYVLKKQVRQTDLRKRIYPHLLRHTLATHLLEAGCSLAIIQGILGHARMETTQVYAQVRPQMLKQWILRCHPQSQWSYPH